MGAMDALTKRKCQPCEGIGKALYQDQRISSAHTWLGGGRRSKRHRPGICDEEFSLVRAIGQNAEIAEAENHHPDIHLTGYRKLKIYLTTHALGGLSENDFIVAAKINALAMELKAEGSKK